MNQRTGHRAPVEVTGIWLRGDGKDIVVEAEVDGEWREVIREFGANTDTISHIVEPSGIRKAPRSKLAETRGADMDYATAWAIQREVGAMLPHDEHCSSVPGWHPLSGPGLLCDCGAVKRESERRSTHRDSHTGAG